MKKINWLILIGAAGLLAGAAFIPAARAADAPASPGPRHGRWLQQAREKLGLSDDQLQQIRTELRAEKASLTPLVSQLHQARVSLRQAIQASEADETSVRAAAGKLAGVEADLAVERMKLFRRIAPVLTREQLDKLKEFRAAIDAAVDRAIDRAGERETSE